MYKPFFPASNSTIQNKKADIIGAAESGMTMEPKITIIEKNKTKTKKPKHYKVVMHNDDYTTMEFVVHILITIFNKNTEEANKIMIDVHNKGIGIAGVYPYDIAVTKISMAIAQAETEDFPFKLTIEEV